MRKITKYNKKIRITYIASVCAICFLMLLAFPFIRTSVDDSYGYYVAELNGEKVGTASSEEDIRTAYNNARLKVNEKSEELTYMTPELKIYKQNRITGVIQETEELEDAMYDVLNDSTIEMKSAAYMVNIDGFTVTLASREEVIELFERAKAKYDKDNQFTVDIIEEEKDGKVVLTSQVVKAGVEPNDRDTLAAGTDGEVAVDVVEDKEIKKGISDIGFDENIEIVECYVDESQIMPLDEAVSQVTKDKEKNQIYVVESGDCLSVIADSFDLKLSELLAMNEGLREDSFIGIGDELIVTVPEPELSVLVSRVKNYNEEYNLPIEYIYNDSQYTTYENVINEGRSGYRNVTAKVTYKNSQEVGREILEENVKKKAVARVVEVGTLTPPTFIKPISGGYLSSGYGYRWGTLHKGVDWACPIGTAVKASCGGVVTSAGWRNGYGYCVDIQHPDGKMTRYGHLSQVLVYSGQSVAQGEKIALTGNTGYSTGPHIHFEIRVWGVPVDPFTYLQ